MSQRFQLNRRARQFYRQQLCQVLAEKYVAEEIEYAPATAVADRQHKMYVIPQTTQGYSPFAFLNGSSQDFSEEDLQDATGLAFAYRKQGVTLWAYQHLWAVLVPNKKKSNFMARILNFENGIVFHEQKESLLTISKKIDLVVLDNCIITSNVPLMQKSFGFQDYIRATAERAIARVSEHGIVANPDKLADYINRGNGQPIIGHKNRNKQKQGVSDQRPEIGYIKYSGVWDKAAYPEGSKI